MQLVAQFREFFLQLQQLVTSRVGLSPILGNLGSQIIGSAGNISGRSSVERSIRSGGGLSVPCLTSRLNLNTNSGFGNLRNHGSQNTGLAGNIGSGSSIGRSKSSRGGSSSKVIEFFVGYTFSPVLAKASPRMQLVVQFREFFLHLQQLVTSRVGLSPILGNIGSQIIGSAGNISGHSSVERSMRSGGGLDQKINCWYASTRLFYPNATGLAGNIGSGSSIGRSKSSRGGSSSKVTEFFVGRFDEGKKISTSSEGIKSLDAFKVAKRSIALHSEKDYATKNNKVSHYGMDIEIMSRHGYLGLMVIEKVDYETNG
nr:probable NOT transcription complex subunit VIP2 isoform X1 [Tanacetum cinerariifolium]